MDVSIRVVTAILIGVALCASALNFFNAWTLRNGKRLLYLYAGVVTAFAVILYSLLLAGFFNPASMPLYFSRPLAMGFASVILAQAIVDFPRKGATR